MKKAIIVHCWEGYPNYCWYPKAKKDLEEEGFEVLVPEMPDTENPKLSAWLPKLRELIGTPSRDLYLVGHSLGCITILRYLESLKEGEKIGGAVLVAGFTSKLDFEEIASFFETPINFEEIKSHCDKFVAIHSDNDPYVDLKYGEEFKQKLNAEVVIKHDMGHFSGTIEGEKSCLDLPEVVDSVLKLSA
jgi:hypothetical protein